MNPARFFAFSKSFLKLQNVSCYSTKLNATMGASLVDHVVESEDGKMFVAWHPPQDFPYECSRPLNHVDEKVTSLLKDDAMKTAMSAFKNKHPEIARQELMRLTHTTKHRWYPRSRDKRAKKTPMDREFL